MHRACIAALLAILTATTGALGQATRKVPVVLEHSGRDMVGQRVVFELREVIRGSQSMRLVTMAEADPRIVVSVVTVEGGNVPGNSTAAAVSVLFDSSSILFSGYFIISSVQTCGSLRTQECARDMAATIDAGIERVRTGSPSLWNLLK